MIEYKQGQEVQACESGLWQIGSFIQANDDETIQVKIGKKQYRLKSWQVKPNLPAYQKDDDKFKKGSFSNEGNSKNYLRNQT